MTMPVAWILIVLVGIGLLLVSYTVLIGKLGTSGEFSLDDSNIPFATGLKVQAIYRACDAWYRSDFIDITMPSQVPEYSQRLSLSSQCVPEDAQKSPSICYDVCVAVLEIYKECSRDPPTERCWNSPLRGYLGE